MHVVGQAGLLAQLLEEPAAGAFAQDRVEQLERPLVGIVAAQRGHAQARCAPGRASRSSTIKRSHGQRRRAATKPARRRAGAEVALDQVDDARHGPCRRPRRRPGSMAGRCRPERRDVLVGQAAHAVLVAGDLPAQRRVAEERSIEQVEDVLAGIVAVRADLLDDDVALAGDVRARAAAAGRPARTARSKARSASRTGRRAQ